MIDPDVDAALEPVRNAIRLHGGDIEVCAVDRQQGRVEVRLHGACEGCALSAVTLQEGVERALVERFAWVHSVVAVT